MESAVGAASSRPEGTMPERFGPSALSRKVGGRLIAAPTGFPIILARFFGKAGSPSSVPGCARSTFLRRGRTTSGGG